MMTIHKIFKMAETMTDEEIAEIGKRMGVDYSYTTWKEAKYMICEDYILESNGVHRPFNKAIDNMIDDLIGMVEENEALKNWLDAGSEHFFDDDPAAAVTDYIKAYYDFT